MLHMVLKSNATSGLVKEFRSNAGEVKQPFMLDPIHRPLTALCQQNRPGPTLKIAGFRLKIRRNYE